MFCNKCGTKVIENTSFCANCGNSLNKIYDGGNVNNQTPGKNYLKVSSIILLIIMGLGIFIFIAAPYILDELPETSTFYDIFSGIHVLFMIYCSIIGIMFCINLEKAKHLFFMGQIALWFSIIDIFFYAVFAGSDALFNIIFVIPCIFYIVGASKNKKVCENI